MSEWKYEIVWVGQVSTIQAKDMITGVGFSVSHREILDLVAGKITMSSFPLPKGEYTRFMHCACQAADVPYKPELVERVTPVKLRELIVEIPELKIWDEYEREAKRLSKRKDQIMGLIESLEKASELMKRPRRGSNDR